MLWEILTPEEELKQEQEKKYIQEARTSKDRKARAREVGKARKIRNEEIIVKIKVPCVFCGVVPEKENRTEEHLIPKALFKKPYPPLIEIPLCNTCNRNKSKDDEYLRDLLVADDQASRHPLAQEIFQTKTLSAAKQGFSKVAKAVLLKGSLEPLYTNKGVYIGHYHTVHLEDEQVIRIFSNIVKGLYYFQHRKRLSDDCVFNIARVEQTKVAQAWREFTKATATVPIVLGDKVFMWASIYAEEDTNITGWLLAFYNSISYLIITKMPEITFETSEEKLN